MSERVLRGSRLGAVSYENERGTELAARQVVRYSCPRGHQVSVPMAQEADVPVTWECRTCGATALRQDSAAPEPKQGKPVRTHWDMLLERRSVTELQQLLDERLAEVRARSAPHKAKKSA